VTNTRHSGQGSAHHPVLPSVVREGPGAGGRPRAL